VEVSGSAGAVMLLVESAEVDAAWGMLRLIELLSERCTRGAALRGNACCAVAAHLVAEPLQSRVRWRRA
jgi:hypothetical protein